MTAEERFTEIEQTINHAQDIAARHIYPLVTTIREYLLLPMQSNPSPMTLVDFSKTGSETIANATKQIVDMCSRGEVHTINLLSTLAASISTERHSEAFDAFEQIFEGYAAQFVQAIQHAIKIALECLRDRLSASTLQLTRNDDHSGDLESYQRPIFVAELHFEGHDLRQTPEIESFQQTLTDVCSKLCDIATQTHAADPWKAHQQVFDDPKGKNRDQAPTASQSEPVDTMGTEISPGDPTSSSFATSRAHSFRQMLGEMRANRELAKLTLSIPQILANNVSEVVARSKTQFAPLKTDLIWQVPASSSSITESSGQAIAQILETLLLLNEIKQQTLQTVQNGLAVGPFWYNQTPAREHLIQEVQSRLSSLGVKLKQVIRDEMQQLSTFIRSKHAALQQNVTGIDELHSAVAVLNEIRENEIDMECRLAPIEEAYLLLSKYGIKVSKEDSDGLDSLQYGWQKLRSASLEMHENLHRVQPKFKQDLISAVDGFKSQVVDFGSRYDTLMSPLKAPASTAEESTSVWRSHAETLKTLQGQFGEIDQKWQNYGAALSLFALDPLESAPLKVIKTELKQLQAAYGLLDSFATKHASLVATLEETDLEALEQEVASLRTQFEQLPAGVQQWGVHRELATRSDLFAKAVPLLGLLANKSMKRRHWTKISEFIPSIRDKVSGGEKIELQHLICDLLVSHQEDVEDVCNAAVKEADIEAKLDSLANLWNVRAFTLAPFKSRGEIILKSSTVVQIMTDLEDSLMLLSSLSSNRYNAPFKEDISKWVHDLSITSETIEQWVALQNLWIYLEAVFIGGDIAKQLPKEAKRFAGVDKSWCKIMALVTENSNMLACCVNTDAIRAQIPQLMEQLEICQKSLSGYLESKRSIFPRFYFVSDPTLLEILGQASDTHTIQPHLKNVFDNVFAVQFHNTDYNQIVGIESGEGEKVALTQPCAAVGGVEVWLGKLLESVQATVNSVIEDAVMKLASTPLMEILEKYPAQVGIVVLQIYFTAVVEEALTSCKGDRKKLTASLQSVTDVLNSLIEVTTRDLKHMDRTKYETFITVQVHHRDVCETLIKLQTKASSSFDWLRQCRFYWDASKRCCFAQITNFDFRYSCEYLGCGDRLVITPLTDRCYITLAQALGLSLGGSPAGPAGTGKTETVKDMGKALGKWVVVFNCSDQMDYRGLGRIFKGLAQSGCWGDFDEFNRIELPVLSVAAQQIACVLSARRERKKVFTFTDGENVELNPDVGIFITMNPGYAGRVELPENLKTNFRYVAMMVRTLLILCTPEKRIYLSESVLHFGW